MVRARRHRPAAQAPRTPAVGRRRESTSPKRVKFREGVAPVRFEVGWQKPRAVLQNDRLVVKSPVSKIAGRFPRRFVRIWIAADALEDGTAPVKHVHGLIDVEPQRAVRREPYVSDQDRAKNSGTSDVCNRFLPPHHEFRADPRPTAIIRPRPHHECSGAILAGNPCRIQPPPGRLGHPCVHREAQAVKTVRRLIGTGIYNGRNQLKVKHTAHGRPFVGASFGERHGREHFHLLRNVI